MNVLFLIWIDNCGDGYESYVWNFQTQKNNNNKVWNFQTQKKQNNKKQQTNTNINYNLQKRNNNYLVLQIINSFFLNSTEKLLSTNLQRISSENTPNNQLPLIIIRLNVFGNITESIIDNKL